MMTVIRDLGQWTLETEGQGQAGMSKESRILGNKNIVSVLGQEEGYTVKFTPTPEGVPKGEA